MRMQDLNLRQTFSRSRSACDISHAARVTYLTQAIRKAMRAPSVIAKVNQGGSEVIASETQAFVQKVGEEIKEWTAVVKSSGVKAE